MNTLKIRRPKLHLHVILHTTTHTRHTSRCRGSGSAEGGIALRQPWPWPMGTGRPARSGRPIPPGLTHGTAAPPAGPTATAPPRRPTALPHPQPWTVGMGAATSAAQLSCGRLTAPTLCAVLYEVDFMHTWSRGASTAARSHCACSRDCCTAASMLHARTGHGRPRARQSTEEER